MKRKKEADSDDDLLTEKRKKKKTKKEAISDVIEDSEYVVEEKKHHKKKKASKKNVDDDDDAVADAVSLSIDMINNDEDNEKQVESTDHAEGKTKKKVKQSEKVDIAVEVQGVSNEEKGTTSGKDLAKLHCAKLNKMLPNRAEKARRDIQKKIGSYVLELRQKGITDPKEVKKLKEKYKKSLSKHSPSSGNASAPSLEDNHFSDISLDCKDCGKTFIFSAAEQKFYEGRGFSPAVRCKPCKNAKKERMEWADETTKKGKKG